MRTVRIRPHFLNMPKQSCQTNASKSPIYRQEFGGTHGQLLTDLSSACAVCLCIKDISRPVRAIIARVLGLRANTDLVVMRAESARTSLDRCVLQHPKLIGWNSSQLRVLSMLSVCLNDRQVGGECTRMSISLLLHTRLVHRLQSIFETQQDAWPCTIPGSYKDSNEPAWTETWRSRQLLHQNMSEQGAHKRWQQTVLCQTGSHPQSCTFSAYLPCTGAWKPHRKSRV